MDSKHPRRTLSVDTASIGPDTAADQPVTRPVPGLQTFGCGLVEAAVVVGIAHNTGLKLVDVSCVPKTIFDGVYVPGVVETHFGSTAVRSRGSLPASRSANVLQVVQHLPLFSLPDGARLSKSRTPSIQNTLIHSLVVTDELGLRNYCVVMSMMHCIVPSREVIGSTRTPASDDSLLYRDLKLQLSACDQLTLSGPVYAPLCLCLITGSPYFNLLADSLRAVLPEILNAGASKATIAAVCQRLMHVPIPPPGSRGIRFTLGTSRLMCRSLISSSSAPAVDVSLRNLYLALGKRNVELLFRCLLTERRILLFSSSYAQLTLACEGLLSLIQPFQWNGTYIPILPTQLLEIAEAPGLILMGVSSAHRAQLLTTVHNVVCCNLDLATVEMCNDCVEPPPLPSIAQATLDSQYMNFPLHLELASLSSAAFTVGHHDFAATQRANQLFETSLREAYLSAIVSLFADVREHLRFDKVIFDSEAFLSARPETDRPFYREVIVTLHFREHLAKLCDPQALHYFQERAYKRMRSTYVDPSQRQTVKSRIRNLVSRSKSPTMFERPSPSALGRQESIRDDAVNIPPFSFVVTDNDDTFISRDVTEEPRRLSSLSAPSLGDVHLSSPQFMSPPRLHHMHEDHHVDDTISLSAGNVDYYELPALPSSHHDSFAFFQLCVSTLDNYESELRLGIGSVGSESSVNMDDDHGKRGDHRIRDVQLLALRGMLKAACGNYVGALEEFELVWSLDVFVFPSMAVSRIIAEVESSTKRNLNPTSPDPSESSSDAEANRRALLGLVFRLSGRFSNQVVTGSPNLSSDSQLNLQDMNHNRQRSDPVIFSSLDDVLGDRPTVDRATFVQASMLLRMTDTAALAGRLFDILSAANVSQILDDLFSGGLDMPAVDNQSNPYQSAKENPVVQARDLQVFVKHWNETINVLEKSEIPVPLEPHEHILTISSLMRSPEGMGRCVLTTFRVFLITDAKHAWKELFRHSQVMRLSKTRHVKFIPPGVPAISLRLRIPKLAATFEPNELAGISESLTEGSSAVDLAQHMKQASASSPADIQRTVLAERSQEAIATDQSAKTRESEKFKRGNSMLHRSAPQSSDVDMKLLFMPGGELWFDYLNEMIEGYRVGRGSKDSRAYRQAANHVQLAITINRMWNSETAGRSLLLFSNEHTPYKGLPASSMRCLIERINPSPQTIVQQSIQFLLLEGDKIWCGTSVGTLIVFDSLKWRRETELKLCDGSLTCATLTRKDQNVWVAMAAGGISVINAQSRRIVTVLDQMQSPIAAIVAYGDSMWTGDTHGRLNEWSAARNTPKAQQIFIPEVKRLYCISPVTQNQEVCFWCGTDRGIVCFNPKMRIVVSSIQEPLVPTTLIVEVNGEVWTGSHEVGMLHVFLSSTEALVRRWTVEAKGLRSLCFAKNKVWGGAESNSPVSTAGDGKKLGSDVGKPESKPDHSIYVWQADTHELKKVLIGHSDYVTSLCAFDRENRIASGAGALDGSIIVWDTS